MIPELLVRARARFQTSPSDAEPCRRTPWRDSENSGELKDSSSTHAWLRVECSVPVSESRAELTNDRDQIMCTYKLTVSSSSASVCQCQCVLYDVLPYLSHLFWMGFQPDLGILRPKLAAGCLKGVFRPPTLICCSSAFCRLVDGRDTSSRRAAGPGRTTAAFSSAEHGLSRRSSTSSSATRQTLLLLQQPIIYLQRGDCCCCCVRRVPPWAPCEPAMEEERKTQHTVVGEACGVVCGLEQGSRRHGGSKRGVRGGFYSVSDTIITTTPPILHSD